MSAVTALDIRARYSPNSSPACADVLLAAKITASSSDTLTFLHLQHKVRSVTLLRVTPLAADGSSSRSTPGIKALGITINKRGPPSTGWLGRSHTLPPGGRGHLDGGEDEEATPAIPLLEPVSPLLETLPALTGDLSLRLSYDEDDHDHPHNEQSPPGTWPMTPQPQRRTNRFVPEAPGTPTPQFITAEGAAPAPTVASPVERSDPFDGPAGSEGDKEEQQESDDENLGWLVSFTRQGGKMVEVDDVELDSFVITSVEDTIKSEEEFVDVSLGTAIAESTPNQTLFYDEDSSVVVTRALRRASIHAPSDDFFLDPASFVSEEESSGELVEVEVDGPADGLMRSLSTMSRRGTSKKWKDQVTMTVKDELVLICFPEKLKSDTYVVEMHLKVPPITVGDENSSVQCFILAGLPKCPCGGNISFQISDRNDAKWSFDVSKEGTVFKRTNEKEYNHLQGHMDLNSDLRVERSIVLRIKKTPPIAVLNDHKIKSKTEVRFDWKPNGTVTALFMIEVSFHGMKAHPETTWNMINLILRNSAHHGDNPELTNLLEEPEEFTVGGPVVQNGELLPDARLLQIIRPPEHVGDDLCITFQRSLDTMPVDLAIPVVEIGLTSDLLEQRVVIHHPTSPVKLLMRPGLRAWKNFILPDSGKREMHRKLTGADTANASLPEVIINLMEPLKTGAVNTLDEYLYCRGRNVRYIEKLKWQIEEHGLWISSVNIIPLHVRMSFIFTLVQPPIGMEDSELFRVAFGGFRPEFMTVDGQPAPRKTLFIDGTDLIACYNPNDELFARKSSVKVDIFWIARNALPMRRINGERYVEFLLPLINNTIVGRVSAKYPLSRAGTRIAARTMQSMAWTVPFIDGRCTLSGKQTFTSRLHLQIPIDPKDDPLKSLRGLLDAAHTDVDGLDEADEDAMNQPMEMYQDQNPEPEQEDGNSLWANDTDDPRGTVDEPEPAEGEESNPLRRPALMRHRSGNSYANNLDGVDDWIITSNLRQVPDLTQFPSWIGMSESMVPLMDNDLPKFPVQEELKLQTLRRPEVSEKRTSWNIFLKAFAHILLLLWCAGYFCYHGFDLREPDTHPSDPGLPKVWTDSTPNPFITPLKLPADCFLFPYSPECATETNVSDREAPSIEEQEISKLDQILEDLEKGSTASREEWEHLLENVQNVKETADAMARGMKKGFNHFHAPARAVMLDTPFNELEWLKRNVKEYEEKVMGMEKEEGTGSLGKGFGAWKKRNLRDIWVKASRGAVKEVIEAVVRFLDIWLEIFLG